MAAAYALGVVTSGLSAQAPEAPARTQAAFADYRSRCASQIAGVAAFNPDWMRQGGQTDYFQQAHDWPVSGLRGQLELYRANLVGATDAKRANMLLFICAFEVAIEHAEHGVPGFDAGARPLAAKGTQASEPPARTEAAVADFQRVCAAINEDAYRKERATGPTGWTAEFEHKMREEKLNGRTGTQSYVQYFLHGRNQDGAGRWVGDPVTGAPVGGAPLRATLDSLHRQPPPQDSYQRGLWNVSECALQVALNHAEHGVPGFDAGARPLAAAGGTSSVAPAARARAATPQASSRTPAVSPATAAKNALRDQRIAEAQRLLTTPAIQRVLRDPNPSFARYDLSAADRPVAEAIRRACQAELGGLFVGNYSNGYAAGDQTEALAAIDLYVVSATHAMKRPDIVAQARSVLAQPTEGQDPHVQPFDKCAARVQLERLGALNPTPAAAVAEVPAVAAGWAQKNSINQSAFATERARLQQARRLHNAANDVTECLQVIPTNVRNEWGTSARFRLVNQCGYPVEASWCANADECGKGHGNLWTIRANSDYPIFNADPDAPYIRVGGCRTATNRVPLPSDAAINRQGGIDTQHKDPPSAAGVGAMPGHICE